MERAMKKEVEYFFYNYKTLKKLADEKAEDVAEKRVTAHYGKISVQEPKQNGYENAIIKALAASEETQKWLGVVDKTLEHYDGSGKDDFIKSKYFLKNSEYQLCEKFFVERRAIFRWADEILTYAAMVALQEGLLKVC